MKYRKPLIMIALHSLFLSLLMTAFLSCGGDVTGPSEGSNWFGWAVGTQHNSHGFIVNTADGGITWNRQGSPSDIPDAQLECVRAIDSLTAWVVGDPSDGYGTILKTTDGGTSWIRQGDASMIPASGLNGISPLNSTTAWAVGMNNTILYTSDGGEHWTSVADPAFDGFDYDCVYAYNESMVWAVGGTETYGIILRSGDGGATWESVGDSLLLDGYPLITVSVTDPMNVWVVGHGYTVASTNDGGDSWIIRTPPDLNRSIFSDDANGVTALTQNWILVTMDYGLAYMSLNGGAEWTQQSVPIGDFLLGNCVLDSQTAWMAGTESNDASGHIQHTSNGGASWSVQDTPENNGLRDVSMVNAHH